MRRDWGLVFRILDDMESGPANKDTRIRPRDYPEYDEGTVLEHLTLMIEEAGLIHGRVKRASTGGGGVLIAVTERLTWEGHDFIANARAPGVWERVKHTLAEKGSDASWAIVKALAEAYAPKAFGL